MPATRSRSAGRRLGESWAWGPRVKILWSKVPKYWVVCRLSINLLWPNPACRKVCMKTNARVVVVGGGMMGASLLYHLALEGCSDTLLIEKSELTSGSTWHAAGQCPNITGSYNLAKIHAYSNELYPTLEALTGQYVSWHPCGGLRLVKHQHVLALLQQVYGFSKSIGFRMEMVGLDEIKRPSPFLTTDQVIAAAWTRDDGHGDPSGLCNALAKAARDLGATVMRHNRVT